MASYQSSFDPPPRPENGQRGMKLETYIQPPSSGNRAAMSGRKGYREEDIAHISGQMGSQQTVPRSYGRQTGLPKPRGPPPAPDAVVKGKTASSFGFRRPAASSSTTSGNQVIKSKHSRNVLRRKPSSIAQHVASPQPESQSIDLASPASLNLNKDQNVRMSHSSDYDLDLDNRQPTL